MSIYLPSSFWREQHGNRFLSSTELQPPYQCFLCGSGLGNSSSSCQQKVNSTNWNQWALFVVVPLWQQTRICGGWIGWVETVAHPHTHTQDTIFFLLLLLLLLFQKGANGWCSSGEGCFILLHVVVVVVVSLSGGLIQVTTAKLDGTGGAIPPLVRSSCSW